MSVLFPQDIKKYWDRLTPSQYDIPMIGMALEHWLFLLACFGAAQEAVATFNPRQYHKNNARCQAVRRGPVEKVVDINLKYVDINPNASTTLLMVHGWPSLWRTMADLVGDLVCLLEHAKVSSAICMGHDWGSAVCYEAARRRPDIFKGVVGIVVPYIPAATHFLPIKDLVSTFPTFGYQLFFDAVPEVAAEELDEDVERSIRATLRTVASPPPHDFLKCSESFLRAWDGMNIPPVPFFSHDEEQYFIEQYNISGFRNTLQFYAHKNRYQTWKLSHAQGNHTIQQPVLAVYPTEDPVADWMLAAQMLKSAQYLPDLTTSLLPGAHWVHLEHPEKLNEIVRRWLERTAQPYRSGFVVQHPQKYSEDL
ncbi:hypothetical protein NLJ89_g2992 [Agrocybe chaxingu]|uniref:AB hydrolase-1 domain-containing protein n=1 Tax=Agrocybe chaxingu TaxID=84603 RepID=A0A9W8MYN5_9AGAR|nr:hypothetical protein NLJ89_g2992 [Agrocybe chaxingu]